MSKNNYDMWMCGPMASASAGIELAQNLYFSYLLDESVKKQHALQAQYEQALKANDEAGISQTRYEIELYEGIFNLTLSYNFDELDS